MKTKLYAGLGPPLPQDAARPAPRSAAAGSIASLQIGLHWFDERPGGLDRIFHALTTCLPPAGVSVRGMVAGSDRVAAASGGTVRAFAAADAPLATRLLAARKTLREMVAEHPPDIVASHFPLYGLASLGIGRDCLRIAHFHGPWAAESQVEQQATRIPHVKQQFETLAYRGQSRYIVLSHAFAALLTRRFAVRPERIRVVPGCVDLDRFVPRVSKQAARATLGWPTDRPILLAVRRLTSRMGLENLITAMQGVVMAVPDALLLVAGRGPLAPALQQAIEARGLQAHARLLGPLSNEALPLAYRAADLTVVPTQALEGFGLITVESLAAGTPVMATPIGGLPEVLDPLSKNLLFSDTSISALADGLSQALRGTLALPDAARCVQYATDHYSAERMARNVAAVYRDALLRD